MGKRLYVHETIRDVRRCYGDLRIPTRGGSGFCKQVMFNGQATVLSWLINILSRKLLFCFV
jgi:hypothetical protein